MNMSVAAPSDAHAGSRPGKRGGARWYAVQCRPHREVGAAVHLANQDFEVFLPLREKTRRHARKIDNVRVPFFPGYLFVKLDVSRERWRSVNGTFGVVRLVMLGDRPAPAPRGVVEALIEACGPDGLLQRQEELAPGQRIRIVVGPFADFIGELERLTDANRVRVLLDIMGGQIAVTLSRMSVMPAADSD